MATVSYACMWEYLVADGRADAFARVYGPEGDWVRLFQRAPGYLRTTLHRDRTDARRFVTVDHWESETAWRAFRDFFAAEYDALDLACKALTTHEAEIGRFDAVE